MAVLYMLEKVSRNIDTVTQSNIRCIQKKTCNHCGDVMDMNPSALKKNIEFAEIHQDNNLIREHTLPEK